QKKETGWSLEGQRFLLRLETRGVDAGLDEVLALSALREGDRVVLFPRTATDKRLPPEQRTDNTPTPKQMLYGARDDIRRAVGAQARVLEGLRVLDDFEPSKRDYIGGHTTDPVLLVQGPPGTGKSYSTAFAILARMQGAMAAGQEFRVLLSCKTHAATDVLL